MPDTPKKKDRPMNRATPRGEDTAYRSPEACDAKRGRPMLWMPMQTPYGIPRYYRMGAGKYSLRRVMEPKGSTNVMQTQWALYCKEGRVRELQALTDRDAAMEQAESWLRENGLVSP